MKKILMIAGASTLLLAAILVGAFFAGPLIASASSSQNQATAASSATNPSCELYLQTLASKLNVSVTTLEQDQAAARDAVINQAVKDGKLTQAQATAIEQRIASRQACTGKARGLGVESAILRQTLAQNRSALISQIAPSLHLTAAQLQSDLQNGQTLSQIAKAQNVSESQLHTIALNAVQSVLNQEQQAGKITQWQNTTFMTYLKNHPALVKHWLHHSFAKAKK